MIRPLRSMVSVTLGTGLILSLYAVEGRAQARVQRPAAPATPSPAVTPESPTRAPAPPQARPDAPAPPGAPGDPNRPPSPFEDPATRLRMLRAMITGEGFGGFGGGRGGRGGPQGGGPLGGGQGGISVLVQMLRDNTALQEEIELTDEQKAALDKANTQARQQRDDLFRQMRDRREDGGGRQDFGAMRESMEAMARESQSAVEKILTDEQKQRLKEIELQIIGVLAVAREDVMPKLNLSPGQQQQIAAIMQQMKAAQDQANQAVREQMAAMFGRNRGNPGGQQGQGPGGPGGGFPGGPGGGFPGGPGGGFPGGPGGGFPGGPGGGFPGGPGGVGPQAGGQVPGGPGGFAGRGGQQGPGGGQTPGGPGGFAGRGGQGPQQPGQQAEAQGGQNGRGFDREAMQARMQEMAETQDQIRKQAEQAVGKVLTAKQKQRFNELLGKPYDLLSLMAPRGRDGNQPGGPRGGDPNNQGGPGRTFGGRGAAPGGNDQAAAAPGNRGAR